MKSNYEDAFQSWVRKKCVKAEKIIILGKWPYRQKPRKQKEKLLNFGSATLNKHEDIKREYKKNFVFVVYFIDLTYSPISFIKF